MPVTINPENLIDRDVEQDVFYSFLQLATEARLLTITDEEGTGKTELLKRLRYNCRYRIMPIRPVSLVLLDEINGDDPYLLVDRMRNDLAELDFPEFDQLKLALIDEKFSVFAQGPSKIDLTDATVSGNENVFASQYTKQEAPLIINQNAQAPWSPERDIEARKKCTRAFFADLKQVAVENSVVLLFDSYDHRANTTLKELIWTELITHTFDKAKRPRSLTLVVAGRELPDLKPLLREKYAELVVSRDSLRGWQRDHVREFLALHGFDNLADKEFDFIWDRVEQGMSILQALGLAGMFVSTRPKAAV